MHTSQRSSPFRRSTRNFKQEKSQFIRKQSISEIRQDGGHYLVTPLQLVQTLPPLAFAVLCRLLGQGPGFQWSNARLRHMTPGMSHRAREEAKSRLKEAGYLKIVPAVDWQGRWSGQVWFVTTKAHDFTESKECHREPRARRQPRIKQDPEAIAPSPGYAPETIVPVCETPAPVRETVSDDPETIAPENETPQPAAFSVSTPSVETDGVEAISSDIISNHTLPFPSQERVEDSLSSPGSVSEASSTVTDGSLTDLPVGDAEVDVLDRSLTHEELIARLNALDRPLTPEEFAVRYANMKDFPSDEELIARYKAEHLQHDDLQTPCNWGTDPERAMAWVKRSYFAKLFRSLVHGQPEWNPHSARAFYKAFRSGKLVPMDILIMKRLGAFRVQRTHPAAGSSVEGLCKYWHWIMAKLNEDHHYSEWMMTQKEMIHKMKLRLQYYAADTAPATWELCRQELDNLPLHYTIEALLYYLEREDECCEVAQQWLATRDLKKLRDALPLLSLGTLLQLPFSGIIPDHLQDFLHREVEDLLVEQQVLAAAAGGHYFTEKGMYPSPLRSSTLSRTFKICEFSSFNRWQRPAGEHPSGGHLPRRGSKPQARRGGPGGFGRDKGDSSRFSATA